MEIKKSLIVWVAVIVLSTIFFTAGLWMTIHSGIIAGTHPAKVTYSKGVGIAGTVTSVIALTAIISASIMIIRTINAFQNSSKEDFSPLSSNAQISQNAFNFLQTTPPRPYNEAIHASLMNGILPKSNQYLIGIVTFLMVLMIVILISLDFNRLKNAYILKTEPVETLTGNVIAGRKLNSRSSNNCKTEYTYEIPGIGEKIYGVSYGKKCYKPGDSVTILISSSDPAISSIKGGSPSNIPLFMPPLLLILSFAVPIGVKIYFNIKKKFFADLIRYGKLFNGRIVKLRRGGKGMVLAVVEYEHEGKNFNRKLLHPTAMDIYTVLKGRHEKNRTVLILAAVSERPKNAYLIEPHLTNSIA